MPSRETVDAFVAMVEAGKFVDAIERFYADDASMQENLDAPRKGRSTLMDGERAVMARFTDITAHHAGPVLIDGDTVVIRWLFRFQGKDGRSVSLDEIAYQRWEGEKVAEERFYYDPAQMRA